MVDHRQHGGSVKAAALQDRLGADDKDLVKAIELLLEFFILVVVVWVAELLYNLVELGLIVVEVLVDTSSGIHLAVKDAEISVQFSLLYGAARGPGLQLAVDSKADNVGLIRVSRVDGVLLVKVLVEGLVWFDS